MRSIHQTNKNPDSETKRHLSPGRRAVMEFQRQGRGLAWGTPDTARKADISLEPIPRFDARGMRLIYGRGDHFAQAPSPMERSGPTRSPAYCMDIWRAKNGRICVRFWSRRGYVDWCSYELHGLVIPVDSLSRVACENEAFVPSVVRDKYGEWVAECLEYPDD